MESKRNDTSLSSIKIDIFPFSSEATRTFPILSETSAEMN